MERLTQKEIGNTDGKEFVLCKYGEDDCDDSCQYGTCEWSRKALLKLKEYEDLEEQGLLLKEGCAGYQPKGDEYASKTNADSIRAMSNEQLAEFIPLVSDLYCRPTKECLKNIFNRGECERTKECALKWLQSEMAETD